MGLLEVKTGNGNTTHIPDDKAIRAVKIGLVNADGEVLLDEVVYNTRGDIDSAASSSTIKIHVMRLLGMLDKGDLSFIKRVTIDIDHFADGPECPFTSERVFDGGERDCAWRDRAKANAPMAFCLKAGKAGERPGWWEKRGDEWFNTVGGRHAVTGAEVILAEAEAASWDALYALPEVRAVNRRVAEEHIIDPTSKLGWVAPDGRWLPCAYHDHEPLLSFLFGIGPEQAKAQGFIRVNEDHYHAGARAVTQKQIDALFDVGFDPDSTRRRR